MHRVEPEIHVIAATQVDDLALAGYLQAIGAQVPDPDYPGADGGEGGWKLWDTDAEGPEELVEVMSRSCYQSFGTRLNPNLTRVREGNEGHLANVIKSGHGSVLEHAWVSFMFRNVSRVFTHELVRHRQGVAISQESLRFVRLDDLGMWVPSCFADNEDAVDIFTEAFEHDEDYYHQLLVQAAFIEADKAHLDADAYHAVIQDPMAFFDKLPFDKKKEYTSAARRVAPIGLATNMGWSCNFRALRHVIEMRTDTAAEEEIRVVFGEVARIAQERWPHLMQLPERRKV